MKKKIYTILYILCFVLPVAAQVEHEVVVEEDSGRVEVIDMPEGMVASEDELMNNYLNRNNLSEVNGGEAEVRPVEVVSSEEQLIRDRLSRIPTTIDMPLNDITRSFIDTYCRRMKSSVSIMLGASNFYMPIFEEALERYDLPLELRYLPVIESALRPSATSRAGAAGLWQFMIATGKRYGLEINTLVDERRDPIKSSEAAAHYLSDLFKMFGDWGLAIAAYNCGENNVQKALLRAGNQDVKDYWTIYNYLPRETRGYVPAFIAANYIMTYYCDYGITPREATLPASSDTVVVAQDLSFSKISQACNVTVDELRSLNPQYRRDIVPRNYALRLPMQSVEAFVLNEDSIYGNFTPAANSSGAQSETTAGTGLGNGDDDALASDSRASKSSSKKSSKPKYATVRKRDTLSQIASRNGTTVANIRRLNGIKGNTIYPGQKLRVK